MFECPLCKDWLYVKTLCPKCVPIKNIVSLVGIDEVAEVLNEVFLRNERGKKEKVIQTRSAKKSLEKGN
mgnify:CR=1 FL=1